MKKIFLFLLVSFWGISASHAYIVRVVYRTTSDGGFWGYKYVNKSTTTISNPDGTTTQNVNIACSDPGSSSCPKNVAPPEGGTLEGFTQAEMELMQQFMDLAINSIGANNLTGSSTQRILVTLQNGTTLEYIFTVVWQSVDDTSSNSSIEIFREQIN